MIIVKVLRIGDTTRTELRAVVLELADLKVADLKVVVLHLVVLRVAVSDVAEIGGADPSLVRVGWADLRMAELKGAETLVTAARTVLANIIWSSSSRSE